MSNRVHELETIGIAFDIVKVVRCKDCLYGEERIGEYRCHMLDEDWDIRFPSTHYCAYGERREQGEWEHWGSPFSDESEVVDTIVCSVCGARFIEPKDEPKMEYNFCPNCGTKMDKGGDAEMRDDRTYINEPYMQQSRHDDGIVAVVRCKDCRHRVHDEERGLYYCEKYYGQGDVSDENFCQWGERRKE